jgi:hypothetical protein
MSSTYPALDRTIIIDFGNDGAFGPFAAEISFSSADQTLTFIVTRGSLEGKTETLPFEATEVGDGIWFITWQESDLLTVVQAHNFNTGQLASAVTTADQQFVQLNGTVTLV